MKMIQAQRKSSEEILHLFNEKDIDADWSFAGFKPSDTGKWTHSYHRYPAKFIPQLVEKLIDEYIFSQYVHVNDPFMGCGTTIITAISRGFKASGTDINKIAYLKKNPAKPYDALRRHLKKMQRGNDDFYQVISQKVKERLNEYLNIKAQDAKTQPVADNSVDLIVSSSPYVTSYEYADLHQLSTIWLDFADNLTAYKKKFIGSAYKHCNNKELKSSIGQDIVNKMQEKSKKMAKEIETFFIDMQEVFAESHRILKKGGRCCYVIGDTMLKGVDILNAEVFAESLQHSGFTIDRIIKREIPLKILPQRGCKNAA